MRRISFILAMVGLTTLLFLLNTSPKEATTPEDLENYQINQLVTLKDEVISQRIIYEGTTLYQTQKGFELICECTQNLKDQELTITGTLEEYEGKKQVRIITIDL